MSETSWSTLSIRECLIESFAGEWGAEPLPGNARVLRATDIDDEGHVIGSGALRRLPIGKLASRQLEDGDILLEGSGGGPDKPVGRVAFFDIAKHQGPAVCSNFFKTLRPDPRLVEPKFLWRKLMWFYRQPMLLTFQQQTTGIINLKFEEYLNAAIEIPANLAEQRAIAQILDTLDTAIRETEALIDKLKAVKQGLLNDLLTRGIDANGQLRPPQSEAPQLYKESPLGWIPREWECTTVSAIADVKSGATPSRAMAHLFYAATGINWVKTLDLNEELIYETDERITEQGLRGSSCVEFPAGTVLVAMYGGWEQIGRTGLLAIKAATNQAISALLFRTERIFPEFILRAMQHGRPRWQQVAASTRKDPNITKGDVMDFLLPVPSKPEQEMISNKFRSILEQLQIEQQQCLKLQQKKIGLMDDLLTGRVRVTTLLESIQQTAAPTGA